MTQASQRFDLEERTARFGENMILFCKKVEHTAITRPLINQVIRSATSIGANYMEANGASSKKDFRNKIYICKKEAQETRHWLRMLAVALPEEQEPLRKLWQEVHELVLIFQKITSSLKH
jgi:four helix bundle protein